MIRFLYGAGTEECRTRVVDAIREALHTGEQVILLVPEQEAVSAERRMLAALPAGAQLHMEVLNFTRLANRVFRTVGGLYRDNVTPAAEALLLYRTLRELSPVLLQYRESTTANPRFADKLLAAGASLTASLVSPELLLELSQKAENGEALCKKLQDLGTIFSVQENYLDTYFGNRRDDLDALPEALRLHGSALLGGTHIFVDSFTDFTGQELEILRVLFATAKHVSITLPTAEAGEEGLQFYSTARTEKRLRRFAAECDAAVVFEKETENRPQDALRFLRKHLFDMAADPAPLGFATSGQITLTRCQTPLAEAEHAAAVIHRLVREGARYREIAIVARDADTYAGVIDAVLEREGIPFFFSEKTDLTAKPLLKLILSALRILRFSYRSEDVVGYLKTGLCGIPREKVDFFEEYVTVWRLRGKTAFSQPFTKNPDGLSERRTPRGERILAMAEEVREALLAPLTALEEELAAAQGAKEQIHAIFHLLTGLRVAEQLKEEAGRRLASGERREAEELARLFSVTAQTLETAATVLGDRSYTVKELEDALTLAFSHTDIGTIPTSVDEVTIGSASMLRADHPRFALVLGLTEGSFPQSVRDEGILTSEEKRLLSEQGVELSGDTDAAASDELFYVWRAFTAPRERLWLSYPAATLSGRAATPSMAITRVRTLFPTLPEECFEDSSPIGRIFTVAGAEQLLTECHGAEREAICALLRERAPESPALGSTQITEAEARVEPALADRIFAHRELSPSQLEKYAGCRFAYYCAHILRLREEADDTLSDAEVGNYIHFILERVLTTVKERGGERPSDGETDALILALSQEYQQRLTGTPEALTPRTRALFERLSLLAGIVVRGLLAELSDSLFQPMLLELSLRSLGEVPCVTLRSGERLPLTGTADRVDVWKDGAGDAYLRVVDYKTGAHSFDPELVRRGGSMQMPLYLLALCKNAHPTLNRQLGLPEGASLRPAGITYMTVGVRSVTTPAETDRETALEAATERIARSGVLLDREDVKHALSCSGNSLILGRETRSGRGRSPFLSEEGFEALFEDLSGAVSDLTDSMRQGLADARPRVYAKRAPCEYCPFAAVCRAAKKT